MEAQHKQRLVGMAVVIGLIVVVIPMLFRQANLPLPPRSMVLEKQLPAAAPTPSLAHLMPQTAVNIQPIPDAQLPMISAQTKPPVPHAVAPQTPGMQPLPIQPVKSTPQPIMHAAPPQPKITQPIQKSQPVIAKTTPIKSHHGKWAVQLGTFGQIKNAKALAHQLRHKHFHAFIRSVPASAHHAKRFKVLVGPEKTKHHAQQTMTKLYHAVHLHGMIIALKKQA